MSNPLDRLGSLKLKLGLVIVLAIGVTAGTMLVAALLDVRLRYGALAALALSLLTVQVVARGMISPLRAMSRAADAIARGEHGQRVAVTTRDEVGQLGVAFNRMAAELEQTDRIRRDLVADAAHELRTPLSALRAVLENAVDGVEPLDPEELLGQVRRLGDLADQLLDLSQLEAGAAVLRRRSFAVAELLDEVRPAGAAEAEATTPVVELADGLRASGDPDRLRQVVANLLENAQRHAPGTAVTVRARGRPGGGVRLEVEDRGPGLDPADAERVFERFARGDRSRTTTGAGLGLAIARSIVELHGGTIRAEAATPHGCRMVVELP
ncbi:sensor kinase two-component system [Patulibacter medicamentivorans]|uniref:histidine kinase n=1 Tax=Patulibacter medicamentivorans TaxID=1097667 RepID=H0E5G1_9ACTN|nr:ATP-binding protein [Patulibacter medicamentivorans]EHN11082.1 sensor kinase two-component system [Patulibacter medicamentivorans]